MDAKGRFNFRRGWPISQQRADFAAEGRFRSRGPISQQMDIFAAHFAVAKHPAKWGFGCENGVFKALRISQLRNEGRRLQNGSLAAKIGVLKLWGFRSPFRSCEMRGGCEMALVCQEVVSQL